jgi:L-ascorbate metabolism protein UlaG (beta-lactamase superfamily)
MAEQNVGGHKLAVPKITLIGGPTALIETGGFRVLTDPTFDACRHGAAVRRRGANARAV